MESSWNVAWSVMYDGKMMSCEQACQRPTEVHAMLAALKACTELVHDSVMIESPSGVVHDINLDLLGPL